MLKKLLSIPRRSGIVLNAISTAVRVAWLRSRHEFKVGKISYLAPTAVIDFESDGSWLGGSIIAGSGLRLSHGAILSPYGGQIVLGENVYVGPFSVLYGHGGLKVGSDVLIAGQCMLIPANHRFDKVNTPIARQGISAYGIVIEDNVWIGSGVRILDGVTIGAGSVVAAGAVVNASIPPLAVAAGVPARVIRYRSSTTDAIDRSAALSS